MSDGADSAFGDHRETPGSVEAKVDGMFSLEEAFLVDPALLARRGSGDRLLGGVA